MFYIIQIIFTMSEILDNLMKTQASAIGKSDASHVWSKEHIELDLYIYWHMKVKMLERDRGHSSPSLYLRSHIEYEVECIVENVNYIISCSNIHARAFNCRVWQFLGKCYILFIGLEGSNNGCNYHQNILVRYVMYDVCNNDYIFIYIRSSNTRIYIFTHIEIYFILIDFNYVVQYYR